MKTEFHSLEPCDENNGGCEANAVCSTEDKSVVVKCTCKEGYVTRGSGSGTEVKCISKRVYQTSLLTL